MKKTWISDVNKKRPIFLKKKTKPDFFPGPSNN